MNLCYSTTDRHSVKIRETKSENEFQNIKSDGARCKCNLVFLESVDHNAGLLFDGLVQVTNPTINRGNLHGFLPLLGFGLACFHSYMFLHWLDLCLDFRRTLQNHATSLGLLRSLRRTLHKRLGALGSLRALAHTRCSLWRSNHGSDDGRRMSQQQFVLALREKGYMCACIREIQEETLQGIPLKDTANTIHPYHTWRNMFLFMFDFKLAIKEHMQ